MSTPADAVAVVLTLLASPAQWELTNGDPPSICQVQGPVCLTRSRSETLMIENGNGTVTITPLPGAGGVVVWNQAVLRVADASLLLRDRQERATKGKHPPG